MNINLYAIWDKLAKKYIRYYVSDNDSTACREFTNFIIEVKQRSPMISELDFELSNLAEFRTNEPAGKIVTNGQIIWDLVNNKTEKREDNK